MTDRLSEIRARLEKATPGPWYWKDDRDSSYLSDEKGMTILDDGSACGEYNQTIDPKGPDADFIANARTDLEWAVQEIERLNKVIAKELTENDELGCEYTYVNVLREEIERLEHAKTCKDWLVNDMQNREAYIARLEARLREALKNEWASDDMPTDSAEGHVEKEMNKLKEGKS